MLDYRLVLARRLGADLTVNVAQRDLLAAGREVGGFEVVIDGIGDQQSIGQSIQLCKPGGRVVVYGVPPQGELALPVLEAFRKDLSIHTSRLYPRSFCRAKGPWSAGPAAAWAGPSPWGWPRPGRRWRWRPGI